jgi:alpha/beta superfamily hydrolase
MHAQSRKTSFQGSVGVLEALIDTALLPPGATQRGVAFITHPHPLFGGTMDNKVAQTLARAFAQCGWQSVRFNFRGVGASAGEYDEGRGELQDLLAAIAHFAPTGPLALAGFSFGAFVASHAVGALQPDRAPEKLVLVGTAATRFDVAAIPLPLHARTLVVHGEVDDTIPLTDVLNWARPQNLPVLVVPGVSHFFHGQLVLLRQLVMRHVLNTAAL